MDKKEVAAKIEGYVQEAYEALYSATCLADEYEMSFSFSPEYGMGGYYDGEEGNWNPSSQSC